MRVAILSRGPSCSLTWPMAPRYSYDSIMAINCAIDLWQADWLIAADPVTHEKVRGRPTKGAVCRSDLLYKGGTLRADMIDACTLPRPPHHLSFSIETAIQFAVEWLKAAEIGIYGHDLAATKGGRKAVAAPGRQVMEDRGRYVQEAETMAKTLAFYRQRAAINVVEWSDDA
jgi:hypothetical protein